MGSENPTPNNLIHSSRLLVLTCLDGKSGPTAPSKMFGLASSKLQLQPLFMAANKFNLNPRLMALDIDNPSNLNKLGSPDVCMIGKINHFDDHRVEGFAMAILAAVARMKARNAKLVISYCDHLASRSCVRGFLYRELLQLIDHCVVPSQALANLVRPFLRDILKLQLSRIHGKSVFRTINRFCHVNLSPVWFKYFQYTFCL